MVLVAWNSGMMGYPGWLATTIAVPVSDWLAAGTDDVIFMSEQSMYRSRLPTALIHVHDNVQRSHAGAVAGMVTGILRPAGPTKQLLSTVVIATKVLSS